MVEVKIDNNNKNQRLDKFLLKYLNKANKSFIYKMLRKKNIKLNGKKANGNEILLEKDIVTLYLSDDTINKFRQYKKNYNMFSNLNVKTIIYEDNNILIINKPQGIIVHSATNNTSENTLINSAIKYLIKKGDYIPEKSNGFKPAVCNRLDLNTSGIVIIGKNLLAVQHLNKMFKEKTLDKIYETVVVGEIKCDDEIEGYHIKNENNNTVKIVKEKENDDFKYVCTKYYAIKSNKNYTHLKVKLITGKTHQIRASFKYIKHNIIGDKKYGDKECNNLLKNKYGLNNQLLHAKSVTFNDEEGFLSYLYKKEFIAPKSDMFNKIEKGLFNQ